MSLCVCLLVNCVLQVNRKARDAFAPQTTGALVLGSGQVSAGACDGAR